MKRTWQRFFITLTLLLMPVMLVAGIAVADRNTRNIGFPDRDPIFAMQRQPDGTVRVIVMDWHATLPATVTQVWDETKALIKTATPHAAKAGAAITETIIDRILPQVDSKD